MLQMYKNNALIYPNFMMHLLDLCRILKLNKVELDLFTYRLSPNDPSPWFLIGCLIFLGGIPKSQGINFA